MFPEVENSNHRFLEGRTTTVTVSAERYLPHIFPIQSAGGLHSGLYPRVSAAPHEHGTPNRSQEPGPGSEAAFVVVNGCQRCSTRNAFGDDTGCADRLRAYAASLRYDRIEHKVLMIEEQWEALCSLLLEPVDLKC